MVEGLRELGIEVRIETGRVEALPADANEVVALVELARGAGFSVAPTLPAEARAHERLVQVSTEKLNEVRELLPQDLMAVVGAGVTVSELEERAANQDLCWPPAAFFEPSEALGDIYSGLSGNWTVEGNIARRYLLALDAVMADGAVLHAGARTVKSVSGYDLKQLFVGSRGTLGIIVSLTLRLDSLANREVVLERYRSDFAGLTAAADSRKPDSGGTRDSGVPQGSSATPDSSVRRGSDVTRDSRTTRTPPVGARGSVAVLERLKRELDPDGVLLSLGDAFPGGV